MGFLKGNGWVDRFFHGVAVLNGVAALCALAIYAYAGVFARYLSDDYCESAWLISSQNLIDATLKAYYSWLNSYSIMLFVQLIDWAGIWGFQIMSGVMILLWVAAMAWLSSGIGKSLSLRLNPAIHLWLAGLAIFLSLYQAPALYQILYWRTGMIPYTLPLVFFAGIAAYVIWYARFPYRKTRALWAGVVLFALVFFASGLGETTAALQIGVLVVAVLAVWLTRSEHGRRDILTMLAVSLIGAIVSILIIAFSPGTTTRLDSIMRQPPIYNPVELSLDVMVFTSQFVWDALKVAPLPNLVSIAIPLGIMYFNSSNGTGISSPRLRLAALILLAFIFFVVGCSFAPSAFVRTYPAARARFAAHFVLTLGLILEGGILGLLLGRIRLPVKAEAAKFLVVVFLALSTLYPLQAASKVYASIPEYQRFAAAWDERDAYIRKSIAAGAKDLVVVQLDSIGGVGEYKGDRRFWINVCAAQYYGLDSITAP